MEPLFLTLEEVLEIHRDEIERHGGTRGVRDNGLLESAVGAPESGFGGHYLHSDLYEMAAAYLFHLVQNHPFIDGNKRVGAAAALVFLTMNGIEATMTNQVLVDLVLTVAKGKMDKAAIAEFFRQHSCR